MSMRGYWEDRRFAITGPGSYRFETGRGTLDRLVPLSSFRPVGDALVREKFRFWQDLAVDRPYAGWMGLRVYRQGERGVPESPLWVPVVWRRDDFGRLVVVADREKFPWWDRGAFLPVPEDRLREERRAGISFPLRFGSWFAHQEVIERVQARWLDGVGVRELLDGISLGDEVGPDGAAGTAVRGVRRVLQADQWIFRPRPEPLEPSEVGPVLQTLLGESLDSAASSLDSSLAASPALSDEGLPGLWTACGLGTLNAEQRALLRQARDSSDAVLPFSGVTGSGKTSLLFAAILERWVHRLALGESTEPVFWLVRDDAEATSLLGMVWSLFSNRCRWVPQWDQRGVPGWGAMWTRSSMRAQRVLEGFAEATGVMVPESLCSGSVLGPLLPLRDDMKRFRAAPVSLSSFEKTAVDTSGSVVDLASVRYARDFRSLERDRAAVVVPKYVQADVWDWMRDTSSQSRSGVLLKKTARLFWSVVRAYVLPHLLGSLFEDLSEKLVPDPQAELSEQAEGLRRLLRVLGQEIALVERCRDVDPGLGMDGQEDWFLDMHRQREEMVSLESELDAVRFSLRRLQDSFAGPEVPYPESDLEETLRRSEASSVVLDREFSLRRRERELVHRLHELREYREEFFAGLSDARGEMEGNPEIQRLLSLAAGFRTVFQVMGYPWPADADASAGVLPFDSPWWFATKAMRERWLDLQLRPVALRLGVWIGECVFTQAALRAQIDRSALGALLPITMLVKDESEEILRSWSVGGRAGLVVIDDADRELPDEWLQSLGLAEAGWVSGTPERALLWSDEEGRRVPVCVDAALRERHGLYPEDGVESLWDLVSEARSGALESFHLRSRYRGVAELQRLVGTLARESVGSVHGFPEKLIAYADRVPEDEGILPVFHEAALGEVERFGGDLANWGEAQALVSWLREGVDQDTVFMGSSVCVVTPFAGQEQVLRRLLVNAGMTDVRLYREAPAVSVDAPAVVLVSTVLRSGLCGFDDTIPGGWLRFWLGVSSIAGCSLGVFGDPVWLRGEVGRNGALSVVQALDRVGGWLDTPKAVLESGDLVSGYWKPVV